MNLSLKDFPEAFEPLVVILGDRREHRPKTMADLLAYSMSAIDIIYLNFLGLSRDTVYLPDKGFVLESEDFLKKNFGHYNILTIGSPSVNLFSRLINDQSLFHFVISAEAKEQMKQQEKIIEQMKHDRLGLRIYKHITEEGAQTPDDIVKAFRGKIKKDETLISKFKTIYQAIQDSGLSNIKELLRSFEGSAIVDPIKGNKIDFIRPRQRGANLENLNDFGFVSFARHPYCENNDKVVIYAAGRHGPATAHSINWLANKNNWDERSLGGVIEIQMHEKQPFYKKILNADVFWDSDDYRIESFSPEQLAESEKEIKIFISAPLRGENTDIKKNTEWLKEKLEEHYARQNITAICTSPYDLTFKGEWNFVNGIINYFPQSNFILHDLTDYSPGVLFEIGCSIGLNKRFLLIWNNSISKFSQAKVPELLKFTNIRQISTKGRSLSDNLIKSLNSIPLVLEGEGLHCPSGSPSDTRICIQTRAKREETIKKNKVLVVINRKWNSLLKRTIETVRKNGYEVFMPDDSTYEISLCKICEGVAVSERAIIDVTEFDPFGLIALGMARSVNKRTLQLYKEGSSRSSMFDGSKYAWREETLENDLEASINNLLGSDGSNM